MKSSRMDNFSDGIFAIIVTLLAFDLRIPSFQGIATEQQVMGAIFDLAPVILSFILSFALIFTYWRAHHHIVSVYAKNITIRLASINAVFFFFVCLIPFSARLLGEYSYTKTAILFYGLNIIFISLSLFWMRAHVFSSGNVDHAKISTEERRHGAVRLLIPLFCAVIAIALSYYNTNYSFILFAFAILFNILPKSTYVTDQVIETVQTQVSHFKK